MTQTRLFTALAAFTLGVSATAQAATPQTAMAPQLEHITIIGSEADARNIAGSGALIDAKQLQVEVTTDINQVMKTIPGTYIREEDGNGLRPNIGIRAATSERSGKVTLMEDGVLIAPAPYSNPAAYYFPTTLRMSSIEVLKGAPLLRYGPQTTGGVVNLISTPIPESNAGQLMAAIGENNSKDIHAYYGGRSGGFGWLLETAQRDSDGFKDIDNSDRDSGFDIEDYVLKLGWEGADQSLLFKAQYSEEVSNETYLGLTDTDFDSDPDRRYGLSSIDQMDNEHKGFSLRYSLDVTDYVTVSALAYHNEFSRDWFKLGGGSAYISAANAGDAFAQGVLDGSQDVAGLGYKHNNRSYESTGLEVNLAIELDGHNLELGARDHQDEMDRYQPVEIYDQINGDLVYQQTVLPTGGDNRLEEADALSLWATDHWQVNDDLLLHLSLRYEDVESARDQFSDPARATAPSTRGNDSDEWLPGISFTYDLGNAWQVLGGVHKGFSPLGGGAQSFEEAETSINYEAGVRYQVDELFGEIVGFYSDFDNKSENCSLANPCSNGATSGSFTTGEAVVAGVEVQLSNTFDLGSLQAPVHIAYTYTEAEISDDNPASGLLDGDELADIPENVFSLRAGLESDSGWNNYAVVKYISEMCDSAGCNRDSSPLAETESLWVMDFISRYQVNPAAVVFLKVDNLLDEQSIVSRKPDGARPNRPRTASLGIEYNF